MHGGVVHIHVVQRHIWVLLADFGDHLFPELEGFQHVGFVDAGDPFAAFARGLESHMGNALDLRAAVTHGVEGFFGLGEVAVGGDAPTAWLAKIDVTGEFADDQDVQPGHQLGFEAGGAHQFRVTNGRAEVGEQAQVLAQAQNGLFGAQVALQVVVFPVTHRTKQDGISFLGQFQGGGG